MKNLLTFCHSVTTRPICGLLYACLIFAAPVAAQNGEPVSDTSYLLKQGSLFFEVKTSTYQDGSELTTKTMIGDTAALVQATRDRITSKAATMAVDIRHVSTFRKQITTLVRESNAVLSLTGIDPQKQVQNEYVAPFLIAGWTIKRDATTEPVEFTVNAQGNLRYSVNAAATKAGQLFGNALRLKNYPSNGTDTDMYILPNGVFVNADRTVILRPPNNNDPVSRSAAPAPATTKTRKKG